MNDLVPVIRAMTRVLGSQVHGAAKCNPQFPGPQRNAGGKILEEALAYIRRSRNAHMLRCQLSTREVEGLHQAGAAEQCLESCNSRALRASGSRCPACGWTLEDRRNWPRVQRNGRWEMLWTLSVHNNSMGSVPIRSPKVEEVDEFEADAPRRGGRLGMVLGRPAWANVDGVDQRWPVVEAAQFDDAVAKMVFVVAPPVTSHGGQLLFMDFRGRDQSVGASAFAEDLEQVGERVNPSVRNTIPEGVANAGMEGCYLRLLETWGECAEELRLLRRRAKTEGRCRTGTPKQHRA